MTTSELYISFYFYDCDWPYQVALIRCKHEDFEPGSLASVLFAKLNNDVIPDSIFASGIEEPRGSYRKEFEDLDIRISGCGFYKEIENDPSFGLKLGNELVSLCKEHTVLGKGRGYQEVVNNAPGMGWMGIEMSRDKRKFFNDSFDGMDT